LQVLDDGRLTDGQGRTVDFKNTVIIMTSNIGSDVIQEFSEGNHYREMKAQVMAILGQHFKPEFINRVDESVVFHPLIAEQIKQIAAIQIQTLSQRLAEQELSFLVSEQALSLIAQAGFDPVFGARPLKRAIQQGIENPLAQKLLAGDFVKGQCIKVEVVGGELAFTAKSQR
jgi:ATP-dependent Clp protease ATP-binding subunit ClpB